MCARRARRPSRRRRPATRGGRCRPCSGYWPGVRRPSRSTASPRRSRPTGTPPSRATSATERSRTHRAASCSTRCGRCLCPSSGSRRGAPRGRSCRGCGCRWRVRRLRTYSVRPRRRRSVDPRRRLVPYGGRPRPLRYGVAARRARPETRARTRARLRVRLRVRLARRLPPSSVPPWPPAGRTTGLLRRPRTRSVRPGSRNRPTVPHGRGPYSPRPFGGRHWSRHGPSSRHGTWLRPVPRA